MRVQADPLRPVAADHPAVLGVAAQVGVGIGIDGLGGLEPVGERLLAAGLQVAEVRRVLLIWDQLDRRRRASVGMRDDPAGHHHRSHDGAARRL